jgi:predicted Zn-dependent protease
MRKHVDWMLEALLGRLRRLSSSLIVLCVLAQLPLAGCEAVPETGRSQMLLLSRAEENQLGDAAYAEMLGEAKTIASGPQFDRVQRVGQRIAAAAARRYPQAVQGFQWQFTLIDTPEVNAWMLPGGKSGVNTGLLTVATTDDELAVVLGHEAAHAVARHGGERMSRAMMVQLAAGVAIASDEVDPALIEGVLVGYGVLGETAFSRGEESEADEIGLVISADAGYDPRAAVTFWQKMGSKGGPSTPEFLSTHPSDETRASRLSAMMPRMLAIYESAKQAGR